jgi:hypothetical protein
MRLEAYIFSHQKQYGRDMSESPFPRLFVVARKA